jgi:hypothetical protein
MRTLDDRPAGDTSDVRSVSAKIRERHLDELLHARQLTDQIKIGVEAVWELIKEAYIARAWDVLGYSSWDDYCTREFGASRLRLPREERSGVVASLRESGLSERAIASATGLGNGTVHRELAGAPNGAPEVDEDALAEELIAEQPTIIGMDGKSYQPRPKPAVREITDEEREFMAEIDIWLPFIKTAHRLELLSIEAESYVLPIVEAPLRETHRNQLQETADRFETKAEQIRSYIATCTEEQDREADQ